MIKEHKEPTLRISTRGSHLALWQAEFVARQLEKQNIDFQIIPTTTTGDRVQNRFLHEIGGKGLFIKELEKELLDGRADLAVHSLKDMPAVIPAPFKLSAVLKRHTPFDCLIVRRDLLNLPAFQTILAASEELTPAAMKFLPLTKIATGSLRRQSLLKRDLPGIHTVPIRGNVNTRLAKLAEGQFDALILAEASIVRLGLEALDLTAHQVMRLNPQWFVPSPAQGALAIETHAECLHLDHIAPLNDPDTYFQVSIEREILRQLGGDCTMPFCCYVRKVEQELAIHVKVFGRDPALIAEVDRRFPNSHEATYYVDQVMTELKRKGIDKVLESLQKAP